MNQANIDQYLNPENIRQTVAEIGATGYEELGAVLRRAFIQAAHGKGKERHAQNLPFTHQPMQQLISLYGVGFALGQAAKKAQESQRLPADRAVNELLGAINYLAGAVIAIEQQNKPAQPVFQAANDNLPQTTAIDVTTLTDADGWVTYDGTNPPPKCSFIEMNYKGENRLGNETLFDWSAIPKDGSHKYRILVMPPVTAQTVDAEGFILFDGTNPPPEGSIIDVKNISSGWSRENIESLSVRWGSTHPWKVKYRVKYEK